MKEWKNEWNNSLYVIIILIAFWLCIFLFLYVKNQDYTAKNAAYCEQKILESWDDLTWFNVNWSNLRYFNWNNHFLWNNYFYWTVLSGWETYRFSCLVKDENDIRLNWYRDWSDYRYDDWSSDWSNGWSNDELLNPGSVFYTESLSSGSEIEE